VPRIRKYDLREVNGIRWWRLVFAPCDFLIDPGLWIRDTRVVPPQDDEDEHDQPEPADLNQGVPIGAYRVRLARPQLYFDHGKPVAPWFVRRFRRLAGRS
jgi:hypothetical protein